MRARLRSWWQKIQQHPFIASGIILALLALIVLIIAVGLSNGTGFNEYTVTSTATETTLSPQTKVNTTAQSQPGKTLWDLLQLLAALAIPVIVGFGVAWFTAQQGMVSERENKDNQRAKVLQDYIDKMSELLLEKNLRGSSPEDEVRNIARIRTLTVLLLLDPLRKQSVLQFLCEGSLLDNDNCIIRIGTADFSELSLRQARFYGANYSGTNLSGANLSGANFDDVGFPKANLMHANLSGATFSTTSFEEGNLRKADISGASCIRYVNFRKADLTEANLSKAYLSKAYLPEANLWYADLSDANLSDANLSFAKLSGANLSGANLSGANLKDATGVIIEELEKQAKSLAGATMPDGSIHP